MGTVKAQWLSWADLMLGLGRPGWKGCSLTQRMNSMVARCVLASLHFGKGKLGSSEVWTSCLWVSETQFR